MFRFSILSASTVLVLFSPQPGAQEPLGSIVAWHRDFPNTPPPVGWEECKGQVITDPESPMLGVTLPDLNGEARFLRGGGTPSGQLEGDFLQDHRHATSSNADAIFGGGSLAACSIFDVCLVNDTVATLQVLDPISDGVNGTPRTASETRPINMSVSWIMKIRDFETPIGSIHAWHKNFPGVGALPPGWVECFGQVLNDPASPYHGQTIPNLNGKARFLRGGDMTGILQDDAFQGHRHNPTGTFEKIIAFANLSNVPFVDDFPATVSVLDPINAGIYGVPRTADETRPRNMSVVWVMKVREAVLPEGVIAAWHRDFPQTPRHDTRWLPCNGSTIDNPVHPHFGETLPALNLFDRFLRGGPTSGIYQTDAFQGHHHAVSHDLEYVDAAGPWGGVGGPGVGQDQPVSFSVSAMTSDGVNGSPRGDFVTRPKNMTVAWLIYLRPARAELAPGTPGSGGTIATLGARPRFGTGENPASLTSDGLAVCGQVWQANVLLERAEESVLLIGLGGADPGESTAIGELLIRPPFVAQRGSGVHRVPIPDDPALIGSTLHVQAALVNGEGDWVLTNALEVFVQPQREASTR